MTVGIPSLNISLPKTVHFCDIPSISSRARGWTTHRSRRKREARRTAATPGPSESSESTCLGPRARSKPGPQPCAACPSRRSLPRPHPTRIESDPAGGPREPGRPAWPCCRGPTERRPRSERVARIGSRGAGQTTRRGACRVDRRLARPRRAGLRKRRFRCLACMPPHSPASSPPPPPPKAAAYAARSARILPSDAARAGPSPRGKGGRGLGRRGCGGASREAMVAAAGCNAVLGERPGVEGG
jgi:hypothetical protein